MIGDIYLALKKWFKQQTCMHEYGSNREPYCPVTGYICYQVCRKCGRWHWS